MIPEPAKRRRAIHDCLRGPRCIFVVAVLGDHAHNDMFIKSSGIVAMPGAKQIFQDREKPVTVLHIYDRVTCIPLRVRCGETDIIVPAFISVSLN